MWLQWAACHKLGIKSRHNILDALTATPITTIDDSRQERHRLLEELDAPNQEAAVLKEKAEVCIDGD